LPIEFLTGTQAENAAVVDLPPPEPPVEPKKNTPPPPITPISKKVIIQRMAEIKIYAADKRKRRLLNALKKKVELCINDPLRPYPDILEILKFCKIPYGTFHAWRSEDPALIAKLDEIEEIWLDDAVKVVHDAKRKNPYIALDLLRSRRRSKYGHQMNINATFTNIHIVSNIARPELTEPLERNLIDKSGRDRTRKSFLDKAEDAQFSEDTELESGENDAEIRQNTSSPIENELETPKEGNEGEGEGEGDK